MNKLDKAVSVALLPLYLIGVIFGFFVRPMFNGAIMGWYCLDLRESRRQQQVIHDYEANQENMQAMLMGQHAEENPENEQKSV